MHWGGGGDDDYDSLYVIMPDGKVTVWKGRDALGLPPLASKVGKSSASMVSTNPTAQTKTKASSSSSSSLKVASKSLPAVEKAATTGQPLSVKTPAAAVAENPSPANKEAEDNAGGLPVRKTSSALLSSPPAAAAVASVPESSKSPVSKLSAASLPSSSPGNKVTTAAQAAAAEDTAKVASPSRKRLQKMNDTNDADDDDDDDVVFSQQTPEAVAAPIPPTTTNADRSGSIDDEAHDDDNEGFPDGGGGGDDDGLDDSPNRKGDNDIDDDMEEEEEEDDDDDFRHTSFSMMAGAAMNTHQVAGATISWPKPQPPFAPSSTSLDLPRRYMCWNHVGSVVLRQGEAGMSRTTVDIDFNDSAFRRPLSFTDNMGFIVGSLGEDGGIFASDVADDDDDKDLADVVDGVQVSTKILEALRKSRAASEGAARGSTIYFHRYETFSTLRDKDWYLTLPDSERVVGCASGDGWAAVITSRRFLRLFTSGGNQGQVIWLDGDPVTIVGRSRFLAVFFHQCIPLPDGTQKLGYLFFDTVSNRVLGKGTVGCLSTGSQLEWAGFSKDLSLLAMDRDGMMSMLISSEPATNWEWMPVLDTFSLRKSTEDSFWPVQVSDGKLICVPLKGGLKYPDAARRPITSSLSLRLPIARGPLTQANALEELSVRASVALSQKRVIQDICMEGEVDEKFEEEYNTLSAQVDKVTLKMFAAIVAANKLERAVDLVHRLHLEKSFELAMTIADRHRTLVDRIEQARDHKFRGGELEDEYDDGFDDVNNTTDEFESPPTYEHQGLLSRRQQQQPRITPDAGLFSRKQTKRPCEESSRPPPQARAAVRQKQSYLRSNY
jgi:Minichromosome loss protein, Mcl1, middle region